MTDLEVSKALALAIGWQPRRVAPNPLGTAMYVNTSDSYTWDNQWRVFDYRDWNVIGPIAAKYDAFPMKSVVDGEWHASCDGNDMDLVYGDTPQKAIALAVIQGAKK